MTRIVWFKNDLRTVDQPAFEAAMATTDDVKAVYFFTTQTFKEHDWAPIKVDLLWRHLAAFSQELAAKGVPLQVQVIDSFTDVPQALADFCRRHGAKQVFANREYPLHERRRDKNVKARLSYDEVSLELYDGVVIVPPECVKTQSHHYYQKFTPFNRAWRDYLSQAVDWQQKQYSGREAVSAPALPDCPLTRKDSSAWVVGEQQVLGKLGQYIGHSVSTYRKLRDIPYEDATSRLSPYWELGMLSPKTAARGLQQFSPEFPHDLPPGPDTWLTEIAWREFYQHLMFHEDKLSRGNSFIEMGDDIRWRDNEEDFRRWCEGRTGYPIVDAGMRQLLHEGYMHNRLRMIVANFLVKDLLLDWRWGEKHFMTHLIDGSFPANNGGWQWSASVGTDAVPYFRVFNPITQSKKFDPEGDYIRKWVKELKAVPAKYIHWPHEQLTGNELNGYPQPMVDHQDARKRFLETFKQVKNG